MPEYSSGLYDVGDQHPLFIPAVWRKVLACFPEMESCQLDVTYGATQIGWIVRERMNFIPNKQTWIEATFSRSLGMLWYLHEYKVPVPHGKTPNFSHILQFCVDNNLLDILLFFTSGLFTFYSHNEVKVNPLQFCPSLDRAIRRNYLEIVRYCLYKFPIQREKMLSSKKTLIRVMQLNLMEMLQTIVPRLCRITNFEIVKVAVVQGFRQMVEYAFTHLDASYLNRDPPKDLVIAAAQHGHLRILQLLEQRNSDQSIPQEAYNAAFVNGQVRVCNYIHERYKYQPGEKELVDACRKGQYEVIMTLPMSTFFTDECFEAAVAEGRNFRLVQLLHDRRPEYKFKSSLFRSAVLSGNSDVANIVFEYGRFKKLPKDIEEEIVQRRMSSTLFLLAALGFPVYNEKTFLVAAKRCDLEIIGEMVKDPSWKLTEKTINQALGSIYVSTEPELTRREAHCFISQNYRRWLEEHERHQREIPVPEPPKKRKAATPLIRSPKHVVKPRLNT